MPTSARLTASLVKTCHCEASSQTGEGDSQGGKQPQRRLRWNKQGCFEAQAVQFADIPVMAAYLCLISLIFVVINLIVDLLYLAVDPRLKSDAANKE